MRPRGCRAGFTLAELIVATMLLSVVMTAVYTLFHSTIGTWRAVEEEYDTYQKTRTAMTQFQGDWNSLVARAAHLFEGEKDEITMFVIAEPMEMEDSEGPQLMRVRYFHRPGARELVREERRVQTALPMAPPHGQELDRERIRLGTRKTAVVATDVQDFTVRYVWVPGVLKPGDFSPPPIEEPIKVTRHRERWGYPQGVELEIKLRDPKDRRNIVTLTCMQPTRAHNFRFPRKILEEKLGSAL
jgi:prepilin-type N-terminal cleavage/methylation domain-containing protein